jgi:dCTP deaminase
LAPPKSKTGQVQALAQHGILPDHRIQDLIYAKQITALDEIASEQIQPASVDLRLGRRAYRVRGSFLPGKSRTLKSQLPDLSLQKIDLRDGAILEKNCVYLVEMQEHVDLPADIAATANPKSSTGRLDVFVRLITERTDVFDYIEPGYRGALYAEISPRSFAIRVSEGSRLNQLRFRKLGRKHEKYRMFGLSDKKLAELHARSPLVNSEAKIRMGLHLSVDLKSQDPIGYRARRHASIVDVDRVGEHPVEDFWEPVSAERSGRLVLDPLEFYILASCESLSIPPQFAAEMVPIDPLMGEFRVHYAGFFDPGFGYGMGVGRGSRAVLEVRSFEVPFFLEHGQTVGRLIYERLVALPKRLYGQRIGSNYQGQGLKLSKHFVSLAPPARGVAKSNAKKKKIAKPTKKTKSKRRKA